MDNIKRVSAYKSRPMTDVSSRYRQKPLESPKGLDFEFKPPVKNIPKNVNNTNSIINFEKTNNNVNTKQKNQFSVTSSKQVNSKAFIQPTQKRSYNNSLQPLKNVPTFPIPKKSKIKSAFGKFKIPIIHKKHLIISLVLLSLTVGSVSFGISKLNNSSNTIQAQSGGVRSHPINTK